MIILISRFVFKSCIFISIIFFFLIYTLLNKDSHYWAGTTCVFYKWFYYNILYSVQMIWNGAFIYIPPFILFNFAINKAYNIYYIIMYYMWVRKIPPTHFEPNNFHGYRFKENKTIVHVQTFISYEKIYRKNFE